MGNLVQLAAVYFLICLSYVLASECPDSVKRRTGYKTTFRDKCYLFVTYEEKWVKADRSCRGWGGNLISIPDMATMNFVKDVMNRRLNWRNNGVWIGANDRRGHGWEWTTGEKISWGYWASGQPGKTLGISLEDCGLMRRGDGWRWHDYHCNGFFLTYRFICQFGLKPTTTTSTTTTTTTTTAAPTTHKTTTTATTTTTSKAPTTIATTTQPPVATTEEAIHMVMSGNDTQPPYIQVEDYQRQSGTVINQAQGSLASSGTRAESDRDTGIVVGFVVGGIILVIIFILATLLLRRRRRKPDYDASVRFQNLSYMHVNRQSPDHATAANVYVDANEMNKLYEEVSKTWSHHGVNDNEGGVAMAAGGGAEGGAIYDVPDDIACCKLNNTQAGLAGATDLKGADYSENLTPPATKLAPKKTNIEMEEKRVVDPNKPSNLQNQEQMYENTTGGSTEELIQEVEGYEEPVSANKNSDQSEEQTDIKDGGDEEEHLYDVVN